MPMSDDPNVVLEFAKHVVKGGGWGEANALAKRYVELEQAPRGADGLPWGAASLSWGSSRLIPSTT